ncbi:MAG: type II secretion system F family protein [Clostridiales bacterium]|nr:type II secretion system F family protein [Clostridiales bacterium]
MALLLFFVFLSSSLFSLYLLMPAEREEVVRKRLRRLQSFHNPADAYEAKELSKPFSERVLKPLFQKWQAFIWARTPAAARERVARLLAQAGEMEGSSSYMAQRVTWGAAGLLMGFLLGAALGFSPGPLLLIAAALGYVLSQIPLFRLRQKIQLRQRAFRKAFPDVLDLLSVSVEAGLGLDGAMGKVAAKFSGPVAQEFSLYLKSIRLGMEREAALKGLAERSGLPEVKNFVASLIQAEKLGTPLTRVLRSQSEGLRLQRRQRAQELSLKAPIKLLFPLVIFIFPTIFIVLLGPAAITIFATLR